MGYALESIMEVDENLIQRKHCMEHHALRVHRLRALHHSAAVHHNAHHVADRFRRRDDASLEDRLGYGLEHRRIRHLERVVQILDGSIPKLQLIDHARARGNDIEIEFTAQALLHNLHVEKTEESATEAESESQ